MVERITDPHRPVHLPHGINRLPDGQGVPIPPRPMTTSERAWAAAYGAVIAAAILIRALR